MNKFLCMAMCLVLPAAAVLAQGVTSNGMERGSANPGINNSPMNSPIEGNTAAGSGKVPIMLGNSTNPEHHHRRHRDDCVQDRDAQHVGNNLDKTDKKVYVLGKDCSKKTNTNYDPMGAGR